MKIIVGLGNPGDNYSLTKHNFGFWVIDKLVKQSSLKYKGGKGDYVYAKNEECMFVKPTTYVEFAFTYAPYFNRKYTRVIKIFILGTFALAITIEHYPKLDNMCP